MQSRCSTDHAPCRQCVPCRQWQGYQSRPCPLSPVYHSSATRVHATALLSLMYRVHVTALLSLMYRSSVHIAAHVSELSPAYLSRTFNSSANANASQLFTYLAARACVTAATARASLRLCSCGKLCGASVSAGYVPNKCNRSKVRNAVEATRQAITRA